MNSTPPAPVRRNSRQLAEFHRATARSVTIADGVIAAGMPSAASPAARSTRRIPENLRIAVKAAYPDAANRIERTSISIIDQGLRPTVPTDYTRWCPLHWVIEHLHIVAQRGGFDAIIGTALSRWKKLSGDLLRYPSTC